MTLKYYEINRTLRLDIQALNAYGINQRFFLIGRIS